MTTLAAEEKHLPAADVVGPPAELVLNRINPDMVSAAADHGQLLLARVRLSDDNGLPRCARVGPPDISWNITTT